MDGLLLIHAFPVDARMWGGQAGGDHTVAPDLPGFGGTAMPDGEVMTMASAAARCLEGLDAAGLDRAVVCGLSMGGYVAFELLRTAPERIAGLVLANTRAGADTPEGAAGRRALAERLRTEGNVLVDAPPPLLSADPPEGLWDRVKGWIGDQPAEAIAAAALGMAERPDSTPDLAGIDGSDARHHVRGRHPDPAGGDLADGRADPRCRARRHPGRRTPVEPRGPGRILRPAARARRAVRGHALRPT